MGASIHVRMVLLLLVALIAASGTWGEPALNPETGLVGVLYAGDCYGNTPYLYMIDEPLFEITPLPASFHETKFTWEEMKRSMRQYMPRTYRDHVINHQVVMMSDTGFDLYTAKQLMWLKRGVIEAGQGIFMVGGYQGFGGKSPAPSWSGSSVADVLPVLCLEGEVWEGGFFRPMPVDRNHEFYTALKWGGVKPFDGMNIVKTRESAEEILRPSSTGPESPLLVYWETGEGSGLAHTSDLTPGWGEDFMDWDWYPDYVNNLIYLVARLDVPQDPNLLHAVRTALYTYRQQRGLAVSLADFVGKFGADFTPIEAGLAELQSMKQEANRLYTRQEYQAVLEKMEEISGKVQELNAKAIELKNRALMWVFLVEWMVVSATIMVCGYAVWTLMVKRRLYREMGATRFE